MTSYADTTKADPRAALVRSVGDQYEALRKEWLATRTPEQLASIAASKAAIYRPLKRCTIEREPSARVFRSIHPYSGVHLYRW